MKLISNRTLYCAFTAILFTLTACKKDEEEKLPSADFTGDGSAYTAGQTINLTNTSKDASTYRWTLPNGTTSKSKDISYGTVDSDPDKQLAFKLEAFSKTGLKSDYVVKIVSVSALTGQVVLYGSSGGTIDVYIDGAKTDTRNFPYISPEVVPDCGQAGYVTYSLRTGYHTINASQSSWNKVVFVEAGKCSAVKLYN